MTNFARSKVSRRLLCILLALASANGLAQDPDPTGEVPAYAPEFSGGSAHPFTPAACTQESGTGFVLGIGDTTRFRCGNHVVSVEGLSKNKRSTEEGNATHVSVRLEGPGVGRKGKTETVMSEKNFPTAFVDEVHSADLNGDGQEDFVLDLGSHGNGLAADIGGVLILLSSPQGYRYVALSEVMKTTPRFLRFGQSKQAAMMLQRHVPDRGHSKDRKHHSYLVFDLLRFDATAPTGVRLDNGLDARFPFWTLFTRTPSRQPTTQLDDKSKKALWRDPLGRALAGRMVE